MTIQGSWLKHPLQADKRGTAATVADRAEMVKQSIAAILETTQGERVMLPDYGLPDFVFSVMGIGFAAAVAYHVRQQVQRYEPLVEQIRVRVGEMVNGRFIPGVADQRAYISIEVTVRDSNTPLNMVFPTWELRNGN